MKLYILLSISMVICHVSCVQRSEEHHHRGRGGIHGKRHHMKMKNSYANEKRIQHMSEIMGLSKEDSSAFWEIAKEYRDEKKTNLVQSRKILKSINSKNDDQLEEEFEELMTLKKEGIAIEEKYMKEFKKILTPRQIAVFLQIQNRLRSRYRLRDRF